MKTLFFLHGLNTFGDDDLHFGPFRWGAMHAPLAHGLSKRGVHLIPALGLGAAAPEVLAERAWTQWRTEILREPRIYILGHSIGGLVARAMVHLHPELAVRSGHLLSIGTPHHGAAPAELAIDFMRRHPKRARALKYVGYDPAPRAQIFAHYTPRALLKFNALYPGLASWTETSLLCAVQRQDLSWPMRLTHAVSKSKESGDGFISMSSQSRGNLHGPFRLDHMAQLGYFPRLRSKARNMEEAEFARLLDAICRLMTASI